MEKQQKIAGYRERLYKTLSSAELTNKETLKSLIKNQLVNSSQKEFEGCSESIVEKRTSEVSNFLETLRSASIYDQQLSKFTEPAHGEWKLKQDTEEFRVMYREGPQGTPFHSLLVEGYVDGPVDVCLCISWESELYKKWWPQSHVPPFKVAISKCLKRIRISEQISLVRMKLMWPLSTREAVVHYYLFEYLQDDLIVVLVNTIPDLQSIGKNTHGYTNDGIPEAKDVIRMDMVGGFAIQKVSHERSYFRTIATMDIKLDFVPPSLINFISRQLVGNGFQLYQKSVTSVSNNNKDYSMALMDPLYTRIRDVLYSLSKAESNSDEEDETKPVSEHAQVEVTKGFCEIKEEQIKESGKIEYNGKETNKLVGQPLLNHTNIQVRKKVIIRPEVEHALGILDEVISVLRRESNETILSLENKEVCPNSEVSRQESNFSHDSTNNRGVHDTRNMASNSYSNHYHYKVAPTSPEEFFSIPIGDNEIGFSSHKNPDPSEDNEQLKANLHEHNKNTNQGKKVYLHKKFRPCCFFSSGSV
ncbi:uncharacterized protein [Rutidosis leptorrhynchoides]|uniref:uncharacterized protein n=1 Tax=Rutidosis leptorrhynchoides TaxID=125765 RepID=UPI003A996C98